MVPAHDDFAVARGAMYMLAPGDSEYCLPSCVVDGDAPVRAPDVLRLPEPGRGRGAQPLHDAAARTSTRSTRSIDRVRYRGSGGRALFPGFRQERSGRGETEIHAVDRRARARRCSCSTAIRRRTRAGTGSPRRWRRASPWSARTSAATGTADAPVGPRPPRVLEAAHGRRTSARSWPQLGFERFAVVGHDRGGRVAYRLALDHPERVTRLAVLDIVPTLETWARMDRERGLASVSLALPGAAARTCRSA